MSTGTIPGTEGCSFTVGGKQPYPAKRHSQLIGEYAGTLPLTVRFISVMLLCVNQAVIIALRLSGRVSLVAFSR